MMFEDQQNQGIGQSNQPESAGQGGQPLTASVPPPVSTPTPASPPPEPTFETPELAKKEIIQEAEDVGGSLIEEKIYTMPEKFRKTKTGLAGNKKKSFLILIILTVVLLIIGGLGFYFWTKNPQIIENPEAETEMPKITPESPENESISEEEPVKIEETLPEEEVVLSLEQTLKAELKGEGDQAVSSAEFYLPEGALLDQNVEMKITVLSSDEFNEALSEDAEKREAFNKSSYQVVGGVYFFEPIDIVFNSEVTLKVYYQQELVSEEWEGDLMLGYFKENLWSPLASSLDVENNVVAVNFTVLPSDTFGIIVGKEKLTPKVEEFQIAPNVVSSVDSDRDGLTDVEETIFSTEANNPDSDADGNPDGQEIIGLMQPLSSDETKLATSGLVNVYTNPTFSYSFFYPASWLARAIPETDNQEVLVITNTGEFFSVTVENNTERLSPADWYLRQSPKIERSSLYETVINNSSAVWNPDHLTIYIARDDRIYILSYNTGTEEEANFKTTFEMLINSFQFVVQPQGRPDMTLIKYPDKPEVYLIEKGLKRPFQSGEIFEKLGFKWEDVIEIPLNEVYADGEVITGRLDGTLVKYPESAAIYLIEGNKKRSFKSGEVFESLGYKWEEVIEIPSDEVYPDGPIIESGLRDILNNQ